MHETTRALATLPTLDIELVHDKSDDGTAERVAIRVTGKPDLQSAAKALEPHLMASLANPMVMGSLGMNPWLNNPWFKMQAEMTRALWAPFVQMNPMLKAMLPPPDRND